MAVEPGTVPNDGSRVGTFRAGRIRDGVGQPDNQLPRYYSKYHHDGGALGLDAMLQQLSQEQEVIYAFPPPIRKLVESLLQLVDPPVSKNSDQSISIFFWSLPWLMAFF